MGTIEFELERTINAPIDRVFARLADIDGHNDWMPARGSILKGTEKTSPGEPGVGTTYLDRTTVGDTPGEIVEYEPPHTLVYHWWDKTPSGRAKVEGWPGYALRAGDEGTTIVRHHARMQTYGRYRLAAPFLRWLAVRERTATLNALERSFA